ncbi:lysosomal Pro-X carboxypeptidase-like [Sycon ciliatum]|uniref:lysosomal Pro-X carboxypeptidase-like n=1 Tax=Sycon ciliatum TaxID=27933 RepID=UPI0031F6B168
MLKILGAVWLLALSWHHAHSFRAVFPTPQQPDVDKDLQYDYEWKTKYIEQKIDHFGFAEDGSYEQRYLINLDHFQAGSPIFFYTGNEGDIELFAANTGFMWELAEEFHAAVVFAEHRYYGQSMPCGAQSYSTPEKLNYFTSEQALADYAVLGERLKEELSSTKLIAFGGSYGGMLTAWFRMKYPHVVDGGLAASAPIFQGDTLCSAFSEVVTKDFSEVSLGCSHGIRDIFQRLPHILSSVGSDAFAEKIKLCNSSMAKDFSDWLQGILAYMAMVNYPYPASFLEPLPAWPVTEACRFLNKTAYTDEELLTAMAELSNFYQNYAHEVQCINTSSFAYKGLGNTGWNYQSCTEMVFPSCNNPATDFFPPAKWNFSSFAKSCQKQFHGTLPREHWLTTQYGGRSSAKLFSGHSNIIFSNGKLDPWSSGGVLETTNPEISVILIAEGAHHLDLRRSNPRDPASVIQARAQEKAIIARWVGKAPVEAEGTRWLRKTVHEPVSEEWLTSR